MGDFLEKVPHAPSKTFKQLICIKFAGKRLQYKVLRRCAPSLQEKTSKMSSFIFDVFSLAEPFAVGSLCQFESFLECRTFFSKKVLHSTINSNLSALSFLYEYFVHNNHQHKEEEDVEREEGCGDMICDKSEKGRHKAASNVCACHLHADNCL